MKPKLFSELLAADVVTPDEFLATITDYAVTSRAGIAPHIVVAVMRRVTPELTKAQRDEVRRLCLDAADWHRTRHDRTAAEYRQVAAIIY